MWLYYYMQARSLRRIIILYNIKLLACERLFYIKKGSENMVKQYIYITRTKPKVKADSIVLRRLRAYASVYLPQTKRSINISLLHRIKSFRELF